MTTTVRNEGHVRVKAGSHYFIIVDTRHYNIHVTLHLCTTLWLHVQAGSSPANKYDIS